MTEKQQLEIENQLADIRSNKKESSTLKAAIKRIYVSAEKLSPRLIKLFDDSKMDAKKGREEVEKIRKQAKGEYNRFSNTYRAAMNKKNGVQARHDKITELHNNAQILHSNISKSSTRAKHLTEEIDKFHISSKKNEKSISDIHSRAELVRQQIEETYGITIDTMLSGTLKSRKDELLPRVRTWEWIYILSLITVSVAIILVIVLFRPSGILEAVTERLVFLTPLLVIAFVASRQFAHERRLLEEYAFKAAAAQALKGYTILLAEQFKDSPEAESQIIEFTIGAMKNIYDRSPLEQKNGFLYQLSFGNKLGKIEAKIQEIVREEMSKATTANVAATEINMNR